MKPAIRSASLVAALTCTALGGCAVGPNYHRPTAANPQRFKEAEGWKPAEPREAASGTDWWSIYGDATLDELEKQIDISNQTLKASEAAWRQATALVSQARAGLFPTIGVSATATRSGGPGGRATGATTGGTVTPLTHPTNEFELLGTASWDIDIWGKIRRTIESDVANAQASEADLAAARLSAQAALASDYIQLRVADEQQQLLDKTVEGYKRALEITQNQYHVGVVAKADVITAQTQLGGAQSQQIAIGVTRDARARHRGPPRQGAAGFLAATGYARRHRAGHPDGRTLEPPRAPAGHRRSGAPHGGCQCPGRRCDRCLLP